MSAHLADDFADRQTHSGLRGGRADGRGAAQRARRAASDARVQAVGWLEMIGTDEAPAPRGRPPRGTSGESETPGGSG
jgi:hypothetical protein